MPRLCLFVFVFVVLACQSTATAEDFEELVDELAAPVADASEELWRHHSNESDSRPRGGSRRKRPPDPGWPFDSVNDLELWFVRSGLQVPMREGDFVEIRVHQQARGPVAIASIDVVVLKHLLGSQLFLAQTQALLRTAMEHPDAKERVEMLEKAFPPPLPAKPISIPLASRAALDRGIREELRAKRRARPGRA